MFDKIIKNVIIRVNYQLKGEIFVNKSIEEMKEELEKL